MLKKCLLGLFVGFVGLIGFGYCQTTGFTKGIEQTRGSQDYYITQNDSFSVSQGTTIYFRNSSSYDAVVCLSNASDNLHGAYADGTFSVSAGNGKHFCFYMPLSDVGYYSYVYGGNFDVNITLVSSPMTILDCQNEYDLIPISSVDTNYCVQNDLCPVSTGNCNNWSELMINNIVHEGKPLINISIPDNIYWDYATNDNQFDLYVGSGYNQDYIDSVLSINSYRPDNEDFTNIFVSGLTLIFPYIFVALLILFIWKLLKRIFK